ncbi:MAG: NACHT domain-containing protein [Saprospiraceae bacterium]|nr:NACHT domain-containing protein [Saprospiraceae bacterium]
MNIRRLFGPKEGHSIAVTAGNRHRLAACLTAIGQARPADALNQLKAMGENDLQTECLALEARIHHLNSREIRGVLSADEARLEFNRINDALLTLVRRLERVFLQDEKNFQALRNNLQQRYVGRLRQKLGERQPINILRYYSTAGTTPVGAAAYKDVMVPDIEVRQTMLETFDAADGRLLVIGHPGVGKTTLLLQLALALLEQRPDHITAVLNLATWQSKFGSFDNWLDRILPLELGVSRTLSKKIQQNTSFILLLDGVDEIPVGERDACLRAIGDYGTKAQNRFVISSRTDEYSSASKDAPVNMQIELRPLTAAQIEAELTPAGADRPEAARLIVALQHDNLLREAVATPFYLNTAQMLFAQGRNWDEMGFTATDVEGRKRELVEAFVRNGLQTVVNRFYSPQKAGKWLSFLARKMKEEHMVMFELANLQTAWMPRQKYIFRTIFGMVNGIFVGTGFYLIAWFFSGSDRPGNISDLLFLSGISIVIFSAHIAAGPKIKTGEVRTWSWKNYGQHWVKGLYYICLGALVIIAGLKNQFLIKHIIAGILIIIFGIWIPGYKVSSLLQINKPYQRFNASLRNGMFPMVAHTCLRLAMFLEGSLPLRLVYFLNEMTDRHLLESDGGSWRFRHKILQDYFAK